ncbi:DUF3626 domain-containing protein [Dactylosporangium sp. AC04546]|uniref:DUF3626 domain-containing protein n=1 Tax=Dactylosporangium sp. AC04546 TaxID=2862460 RepID=UPI001EDE1E30|nr:DUF3626 domain-containing protein [Dactylosporangium sp. AC04546]WVK85308.1 DUF3626 domain-containing protein [Dactylosporangium sp. AC04546]
MLTDAQLAALAFVRAVGGSPYRTDAPITINFHPDRTADGRTVIEGLLADGRFRSQFETGISNGGLTAHPGGDRDRWEERMFGGAYQRPGVSPIDRPKYGALNVFHHPDGAAPRFGSAYLRLRPAVLERATYTFGDSFRDPTEFGTIDAFSAVLAGLERRWGASALSGPRSLRPGRALDDYVEAQVHGPVELATDVAALVLDTAFRDTPCAAAALAVTARYGVAVEWREGFRIAPADVPPEFRGPSVPLLAVYLSDLYDRELVDAELIGRAARAVVAAPAEWSRWGAVDEALQLLKYLWHVLVEYGH